MKGSLLPMLVTLSTTLMLYGCGADETNSNADIAQASTVQSKPKAVASTSPTPVTNSLSVFLSLHKQYCESDMRSREALITALEQDKRFEPATGFVGVFETKVDGISYAVSPEVDGCTTDVMVKNEVTGQVLFSYAEMNKALTSKGYQVVGNETTRKDVGSDRREVTILEKTFISPRGEVTNLDYPADRPDKYYMTLFAKKFAKDQVPAAVSMK